MPIRLISFHPLHWAVIGYGAASAEVLAVITPGGFGAWVQALNVALMVTGSTIIVLWQRAQNAARQERIAYEVERHQSYQAKIGQLAGQLDEYAMTARSSGSSSGRSPSGSPSWRAPSRWTMWPTAERVGQPNRPLIYQAITRARNAGESRGGPAGCTS